MNSYKVTVTGVISGIAPEYVTESITRHIEALNRNRSTWSMGHGSTVEDFCVESVQPVTFDPFGWAPRTEVTVSGVIAGPSAMYVRVGVEDYLTHQRPYAVESWTIEDVAPADRAPVQTTAPESGIDWSGIMVPTSTTRPTVSTVASHKASKRRWLTRVFTR